MKKLILKSTLFLFALTFSVFATAKVKTERNPNLQSNCGAVVSVKVLAEEVEVIYHPENAPPIEKGGNNRSEVFRKKEFDPVPVTNAAFEVMRNKKLIFCGGVESKDKSKINNGFWVSWRND